MRRINRCLNNKVLEICQRVVQLEELNTTLVNYLPESLRNHCSAGSFTRGCLVLITQDPVWASQLRYCLPELRDKLRSEAGLYQLTSIKVSVEAETLNNITIEKKTAPISMKSRKMIISQANGCRFLPLQQALYRLADHQKE